jgi:hypothetical protein
MTQLLQQALAELQKLDDADQDAVAAIILAEIADEGLWQRSFQSSQSELSRAADNVRRDIRAGRVREAGFDDL